MASSSKTTCSPFQHKEKSLKTSDELKYSETNMKMLENATLCDVTLITGEQKEHLKSHKFILASRSDVFNTMFSGNYMENSGVVDIPDIEPYTLKIVLRYLYSGNYDISSLSGDQVVDLYYAASKYKLDGLIKMCNTFFEKNISIDNFFSILNHAVFFDDKDLLITCDLWLCFHSSSLADSELFTSLSKEALKFLVASNCFNAEAGQIYKACIRWSKKQCDQQKIGSHSVRDLLAGVLPLIQFTTMTADNFTSIVSTEDVLNTKEKKAILQVITKNPSSKDETITQLRFSSPIPKRKPKCFGPSVQDIKRPPFDYYRLFEESFHMAAPVEMGVFAMYFTIEKRKPEDKLSVLMQVNQGPKVLHDKTYSDVYTTDSGQAYILFEPFVRLRAGNLNYFFQYSIKGCYVYPEKAVWRSRGNEEPFYFDSLQVTTKNNYHYDIDSIFGFVPDDDN